jgi:hypothetical protein
MFALACFIIAMLATWLWACEVWQRPLAMMKWDEGIILAVAVAMICAGGSLVLLNGSRLRWFRAILVLVSGCMMIAGISKMAHVSAIRELIRHHEVANSIGVDSKAGVLPRWLESLREWWDSGRRARPESSGLIVTKKRHSYEGLDGQALDHLLESSRWRVRKAFLLEIMHHEAANVVVTRDWHRLFPAVVGQDVTLARRRELLSLLDAMANDASTLVTIHNVAVFWMGLIVVTDVQAFAADRARVRDLMLSCDDPPMSLTGDVWMRVLNVLMAFDGPTGQATHSKRLTRDGMLLRRAVREGVRGIDRWTGSVIKEIEALDTGNDPLAATALWLDLHHLIANQDGHAGTRQWLGETMARWLMEDSEMVRKRFSHDLRVNGTDFFIELPRETRNSLAAHAMDVIKDTPPPPAAIESKLYQRHAHPVELEHALMIRNFLEGGNRRAVSIRVASILCGHVMSIINHHEPTRRNGGNMNEQAGALLVLWNDLDAGTQERIRQAATRLYETHYDARFGNGTTDLLLFLAGSTPGIGLRDSERLAEFALRRGRTEWWHVRWWGKGRGSHSQEHSPEAVDELIDALLDMGDSRIKVLQTHAGPQALRFRIDQLTQVLHFNRYEIARETDAVGRDYLRASLFRARVTGAEHLPGNLMEIFHSDPKLHAHRWDFPDPQLWALLMAGPRETQALLDRLDVPNDYILRGMMEYLRKHPPEPGIQEVILRHFESRLSSGLRSQRLTAARVLLNLSAWRDPQELADLRDRLLVFFQDTRPSPFEWVHTMMLPMDPAHDYPRRYAINTGQCRSEWIGWEDDGLSAAFSWSSQVHHELALLPHDWKLRPDDGLFMYLNSFLDACDACPWAGARCEPVALGLAIPSGFRRGLPPDPPFAATPWQRARDLHLRRPDLEFPDRAIYRPHVDERS